MSIEASENRVDIQELSGKNMWRKTVLERYYRRKNGSTISGL